MKNFIGMSRALLLTAMLSAVVSCGGETATISNGCISLSFEREGGRLVSFRNIKDGKEMIDTAVCTDTLWRISTADGSEFMDMEGASFALEKVSGRKVRMTWKSEDGKSVAAEVELDGSEPVSLWSVDVGGVDKRKISVVTFPIISGIKPMENEKLAVPVWQGVLRDIKRQEKTVTAQWWGPGSVTMQFLALYGKDSTMVFFGSRDTESRTKGYRMEYSLSDTRFSMVNKLPLDYGSPSYSPGYPTAVGFTEGDWYDAAVLYRKWAVEQKWCRDSRLASGKTPQWAKKTALWVWNRGYADNVIDEAIDAKEFIDGLPVSVLWHWWHKSPYDDGFPEYLLPKDGTEKFRKAVAKADSAGIHELVYMNSIQWGNSTESWEKENAADYCARTQDGGNYAHVFNIFTGHALVPMCMGTDFWRNKYSSLADSVVCGYGVSGVYMDQACMSCDCYNPSHGHPVGPGDYWIKGFQKLTDMIRERTAKRGKNPALAGEGTGESWISALDLFLVLESRGWNNATIPLFQTVYHDYALAFGNYSSLVYPPYDWSWPDKSRPKHTETELPEQFNAQFRMEQAINFTRGIQPMIANYHSFLKKSRPLEMQFLKRLVKTRYNAYEYLGCGVYARTPEIPSPSFGIPVTRESIYTRGTPDGVLTADALYSSCWKSAEGNVAVAVANMSETAQNVSFVFRPEDYGFQGGYEVNVITHEGKKTLVPNVEGNYEVNTEIAACDALVMEFRQL